ncbi:hypothetical protein ACFQJC_11985 [Haloferax namakaokahaiae]|uniref:Uncharacterized protein n=1 Tax=Haloferax namakaokahaiae TaxID=1748331 RepID=A0ABD5ZGS8_9EURY
MDALARVSLLAVVIIVVASGPAAAATQTSPCFAGEGHQFDIGGNGAGIDLVVFLSLFENLGGAGGFGMEAHGSIGNQSIIQLRAGVSFDGVGSLGKFLSNPFSRFSIVSNFSMDLPMFAGTGVESSYSDDSPVGGVKTKQC